MEPERSLPNKQERERSRSIPSVSITLACQLLQLLCLLGPQEIGRPTDGLGLHASPLCPVSFCSSFLAYIALFQSSFVSSALLPVTHSLMVDDSAWEEQRDIRGVRDSRISIERRYARDNEEDIR